MQTSLQTTMTGPWLRESYLTQPGAQLVAEHSRLTGRHFWSLADPAERHVAPPAADADAVVVSADEDEVALHVAGHAAEGSAVRQGDDDGECDQVSGRHSDSMLASSCNLECKGYRTFWPKNILATCGPP